MSAAVHERSRSAARRRVLPGFGPRSASRCPTCRLLVLIPLAGVFLKAATLSWREFWQAVAERRARSPPTA